MGTVPPVVEVVAPPVVVVASVLVLVAPAPSPVYVAPPVSVEVIAPAPGPVLVVVLPVLVVSPVLVEVLAPAPVPSAGVAGVGGVARVGGGSGVAGIVGGIGGRRTAATRTIARTAGSARVDVDARTGGGAPGNDHRFAVRAPAMATDDLVRDDLVRVAEAMHRIDQIYRSGAKAGRGGNGNRFSARGKLNTIRPKLATVARR